MPRAQREMDFERIKDSIDHFSKMKNFSILACGSFREGDKQTTYTESINGTIKNEKEEKGKDVKDTGKFWTL